MSAQPAKKKKRDMISFDPPEDVRGMLEGAQEATGADRSTLIIEAIRTDLPKVVRRLIAQRREAEERFFRIATQSEEAKPDSAQTKKRAAS